MRQGARPTGLFAFALLLGACAGEDEVELALQYCLQDPETIVSVEVVLEREEPFTAVPSDPSPGITVTLDSGKLVYRITAEAPGFPNTRVYLGGRGTVTVTVRALGFDGYVLGESPPKIVSLSSPDLVTISVVDPDFRGECTPAA